KLDNLERRAEPWGADEIATRDVLAEHLKGIARHHDALPTRVLGAVDRLRKLDPKYQRGLLHLDDVDWQQAKGKCENGSDYSECRWVDAYLERHPRGQHVADAHRINSSPRVQQLKQRYETAVAQAFLEAEKDRK